MTYFPSEVSHKVFGVVSAAACLPVCLNTNLFRYRYDGNAASDVDEQASCADTSIYCPSPVKSR